MKYLIAVAIMAAGLIGLTAGGAGAATKEPLLILAHHNTQHSLGPCGIFPCPEKEKVAKPPKGKRK